MLVAVFCSLKQRSFLSLTPWLETLVRDHDKYEYAKHGHNHMRGHFLSSCWNRYCAKDWDQQQLSSLLCFNYFHTSVCPYFPDGDTVLLLSQQNVGKLRAACCFQREMYVTNWIMFTIRWQFGKVGAQFLNCPLL